MRKKNWQDPTSILNKKSPETGNKKELSEPDKECLQKKLKLASFIIVKDWMLSFLRAKQGCLLLPLLFSIVLEVIAGAKGWK